ncbi:MAG: O-antigen polymerase [Planctomycetota bacterium]|jgi:oligosaccharide repeat unit polymerase
MMRYVTNPLFVFVAVWTVAVGTYAMGVFSGLFPATRPATMAAVSLNVLTFCLGYLTWALFERLNPPARRLRVAPMRPLNPERVAAALRFTLLMGLVTLGFGFARIAMVASHFDTSFFRLLTHPGLLRWHLVRFIGGNIFEISYIAMLISVASSLFSIGFVLLGIFLSVSTSIVRYVYLGAFLFISIVIGLTNLSRLEVTVHVLYIVLAYCFMHAQGGRGSARQALLNLIVPLGAVTLLFVAIELLLNKGATYDQLDRFRGFLFSFYWYMASPLAAFNEFIAGFDGHYSLGQNMFFPFYKWLCRLNLAPPSDVSVYGRMVFIPYPANVYTYLRNLYEDFGMMGVVVTPYVLGWMTCLLKTKATRSFPYLNLYLILLVFLLFSFYNYYLFSNQVYMQMLFAFIFFRYELSDLHEADTQP